MSSKTTTAASDKVDVSFATDDEEEETSSDDSENETTSSSGSDDQGQSDGDGDADDESDMPTFTLSLQPSADANDVDDTLPDLTISAFSSKRETQQETVVTFATTETKTEAATSQPTSSSTKVDDVVSKETPPAIPDKEEVEEESTEESEESEESEQEMEDEEEEEEGEDKEKHLPPASAATTSSSLSVSTTSAKEGLSVTSSKSSVSESKIYVKEVTEEQTAVAVVETKTAKNAEKTSKKNDSVVTRVDDKQNVVTKAKEESSAKKTVVTEQAANVNVDVNEELPNLSTVASKAKAAKSEVATETKTATNPQSSKKIMNESVQKEAKLETAATDAVDSTLSSASIGKSKDLKHEDDVKETQSKDKKTKATKIQETTKTDETAKPETKKQIETVDSPKPSKSRKVKTDVKETKQEATSTTEEEQTASVAVVTKQITEESQPDVETIKPEVNHKKTRLDKNDKAEATTVKTTDMSNESIKKSTNTTIAETTISSAEVAVNGCVNDVDEGEKAAGPDILDEKKKPKHSAVDNKESNKITTDSQAVTSDLQHGDKKFVLESNAVAESGVEKTEISQRSVNTTASETERKLAETRPNKDKSLLEAKVSSDEVTTDDMTLNSVEDEGKLLVGEDTEFRPRRNSIDEFIKRILAEAREEQKKILDSCAVETTSETSVPAITNVSESLPTSRDTELEIQQQQQPQQLQQPIVNGIDVSLTTRTARRTREDFDIDEELADISRIYAKRTLLDHVATNDEEPAESISQADDSAKSMNGGEKLHVPNSDEVLHFVPQRRESTAAVVRESSRPVKVLVDQQTSVIRQLTETSRAIDELDNEIRQLRQTVGGREALYVSIGAAISDELRTYELEMMSAAERINQQKVPGRFIREQFVAQCAAELLQRTAATTNVQRLDRAATVDEWTRVGRRRSGSFSAGFDEDVGSSVRTAVRPWIPTGLDRDTTDLMIQLRQSRSGSVASDRGYSSFDNADESRATTSSVLSRLTTFNGSSTTSDQDFERYSRASSEAPRPAYRRSHTTSDDWLSAGNSTYSVGRQYIGFVQSSADDGELDVGYRVSSSVRPVSQHVYRRYQPSHHVDVSHSRLYVRRGSLQGYNSYDSTAGAGSFNSRFLSRVREKKALGEPTTPSQTSDRPFRSRFLKSSSGTSNTYSSSRSTTQYDSDDN